MKSILIIYVLTIFVALSYAQPSLKISNTKVNTPAVETVESEALEVTDVGNTVCPVDGNEIDPETKATYEYKGKAYNFCCPECINKFMEAPEKYIATLEEN